MIEVEQLSLFTMLSPVQPAVAVCCMDGSRVDATTATINVAANIANPNVKIGRAHV